MNNCKTKCEEEIFNKVSETFEYLAHPLRLKIVCNLTKCGSKTCNEIVEFLNQPQNLVSHHLGILRKSGLVNTEKKGKFVFYSINKKAFSKLKNNLKELFSL